MKPTLRNATERGECRAALGSGAVSDRYIDEGRAEKRLREAIAVSCALQGPCTKYHAALPCMKQAAR